MGSEGLFDEKNPPLYELRVFDRKAIDEFDLGQDSLVLWLGRCLVDEINSSERKKLHDLWEEIVNGESTLEMLETGEPVRLSSIVGINVFYFDSDTKQLMRLQESHRIHTTVNSRGEVIKREEVESRPTNFSVVEKIQGIDRDKYERSSTSGGSDSKPGSPGEHALERGMMEELAIPPDGYEVAHISDCGMIFHEDFYEPTYSDYDRLNSIFNIIDSLESLYRFYNALQSESGDIPPESTDKIIGLLAAFEVLAEYFDIDDLIRGIVKDSSSIGLSEESPLISAQDVGFEDVWKALYQNLKSNLEHFGSRFEIALTEFELTLIGNRLEVFLMRRDPLDEEILSESGSYPGLPTIRTIFPFNVMIKPEHYASEYIERTEYPQSDGTCVKREIHFRWVVVEDT